jgi:hypothetical protein
MSQPCLYPWPVVPHMSNPNTPLARALKRASGALILQRARYRMSQAELDLIVLVAEIERLRSAQGPCPACGTVWGAP